ncbi:CCA tRNA nucleotidyltransferase [Candidatus Pelagibacter sp.]|jgi:poly(A) polymerase|nr:CCA tRNA nucleotidyltransferase [Candidatus Pelagibacter bacterium]MDA9199785.1 CCA tRNA nucleotidyltransferase [Candidatus Pelagibacter sp.]MDA8809531.1 CCA tRNA nucleotidyltransferase [Candidatus Pelagibacter bacterium]MDB4594365.1 CCA tRNA nucleotidyltransferase [Candidatus Pelagibacter sp.]MDB4834513.1 CCA tRNA nucleotidyltransferase [Candidatus Pelagibacter sp.]
MDKFLDKIFFRSRNLDYISQNLKDITNQTPANKIFEAINNYSESSEVRYVGGCIRKVINKEVVDDIDLATNLKPNEICEALKNKDINFYETGIEHGTVTAVIDEYKYEITSLRKDVKTDGRHAKVEFSLDWKEDAARRDFSINSIYSDASGNLFDPNNGKKDLEEGLIHFIGDAEIRIKEDYLRILRYVRFFLNYSNHKHKPEIIKIIKRNIGGISKLSSERLIDEFKKLTKSHGFVKLFQDNDSLEIIEIIFPQLKNLAKFKKLNTHARDNLFKIDFIFLLSLMIVDGTDNTDYFLYKFNISKKDQKRLKLIDFFYKEKTNLKNFTEKNFNKIFYFNGKQAVIDIINFKLFTSNKVEKKLIKLIEVYKDKVIPTMPIGANTLMAKYNIPEGKILGNKLKMIEEAWVENGFAISEKNIQKIAKG